MRATTIGAFLVGLAVGAVCLAFGLWLSGSLVTPYSPPWRTASSANSTTGMISVLPAPPADLHANAKLPAPPVPPPQGQQPPLPPATTPAQGFAERTAPTPATAPASVAPGAPLHLSMPIAGINPATLKDTFYDARDGHQHDALDIPAPRGTPVKAVAEGNVAKLFTSKQGGLTVYQFNDSEQYCFYYAHLDHYASGLKEGTLLRPGDVLGYVGTTGDAPPNAPHLHFAVFKLGPDKKWWQGTALDPLPMLK